MQLAQKNVIGFGSLLALFSGSGLAGTITELKVDGNTVIFKTSDVKSHAVPDCVQAAHKADWAIDLNTLPGQAKYSTLVTAMSAKAQVAITSAQTCLNDSSLEKVQSVSMVHTPNQTPGLKFAGITHSMNADFSNRDDLSALMAMDKKCDASFAGSRVMLWDDHRSMKGNYPEQLTKREVVILDPVEHISYLRDPNRPNYTVMKREITFKNGQYISEQEWGNPGFSKAPFCNDFSTTSEHYFVYVMYNHKVRKQTCNYTISLACVY
ncbi:hypothetical protein [Pseudoalteromonas rubra]|uniref:Uncharacterized protein n=1 Tax=Pseudoalteromonas rubra TaxID=43658 RepID=A0A0U3IAD9_9GAMM|nr:hypothetical protein [Pseudoalteromonas rubra]ALU44688.1 hypothetical protein AT705_18115 [Pseudoalteromonas rubra]